MVAITNVIAGDVMSFTGTGSTSGGAASCNGVDGSASSTTGLYASAAAVERLPPVGTWKRRTAPSISSVRSSLPIATSSPNKTLPPDDDMSRSWLFDVSGLSVETTSGLPPSTPKAKTTPPQKSNSQLPSAHKDERKKKSSASSISSAKYSVVGESRLLRSSSNNRLVRTTSRQSVVNSVHRPKTPTAPVQPMVAQASSTAPQFSKPMPNPFFVPWDGGAKLPTPLGAEETSSLRNQAAAVEAVRSNTPVVPRPSNDAYLLLNQRQTESRSETSSPFIMHHQANGTLDHITDEVPGAKQKLLHDSIPGDNVGATRLGISNGNPFPELKGSGSVLPKMTEDPNQTLEEVTAQTTTYYGDTVFNTNRPWMKVEPISSKKIRR